MQTSVRANSYHHYYDYTQVAVDDHDHDHVLGHQSQLHQRLTCRPFEQQSELVPEDQQQLSSSYYQPVVYAQQVTALEPDHPQTTAPTDYQTSVYYEPIDENAHQAPADGHQHQYSGGHLEALVQSTNRADLCYCLDGQCATQKLIDNSHEQQQQYYEHNAFGQVYQTLQVVSAPPPQAQAPDQNNLSHPQEHQHEQQQVEHHHVQYGQQLPGAVKSVELECPPSHQHYYLNSEASFSSAASPSSSTEESSSVSSTLTRDERRAREANIPMSYSEIVNSSIEQFNDLLSSHQLSEPQLTLIKDIRRRGKNKVAAQSCRKRKMDQIYDLQHEVNNLIDKRKSLGGQYEQLVKEHDSLVREYDEINSMIRYQMQ